MLHNLSPFLYTFNKLYYEFSFKFPFYFESPSNISHYSSLQNKTCIFSKHKHYINSDTVDGGVVFSLPVKPTKKSKRTIKRSWLDRNYLCKEDGSSPNKETVFVVAKLCY